MNISCSSAGAFLTATALLAAILLVWAQFWGHTYQRYQPKASGKQADKKERVGIEFVVGLGFFWTHIAVVFALAAFALAAWTCWIKDSSNIPPTAIGCLVTSFLMTITNVLQSFVTLPLRLIFGKPLGEPSIVVRGKWRKLRWILAFLFAVVGLGLISFFQVGILCLCCFRLGLALFLAAVAYVLVEMVKGVWKLKKEQ